MDERFIGTWKLISSEMRISTGEIHYPLGEDCIGNLVFDACGNLSAQLMRVDRPQFASGDILRGTSEEVMAAYQGYVAFWAKFEVDQEKQELTYVIEGSLFPNWNGHKNLRYYELVGDRLTLKTPPFLAAGNETVGVLLWERIC